MMPVWISNNKSLSEYSTPRALELVRKIAEKPHYVGSENHEVVANYLEKELRNLGLETKIQEGTTLSDWGNLVKSKNIMARIKGSDNTKALLLLSHYDSAPHSYSHGASDNGVGVATILEGLRAFIHNKTAHKNDIIILFSDAEELGLNGAALFVSKSKWAKDIGLVLNFEARGTSGPSYMLMEVNQGNAAMVHDFIAANPRYPVSNSLMYSIYKMLPNDTDLTVFREEGKIQGFNFAFIDKHFNYHTEQDDYAHLNPTTLAHQGTYLMPLLNYFSNSNLNSLNSTEDYIYFNTPLNFVSYPFSWILPMVVISFVFFLLLVFIGLGKRILFPKEIMKGFIPLFGALLSSGLTTFIGWKILIIIYPQYSDILQGFTYNGHAYIAAFVFLSLAICFLFYAKAKTEIRAINLSIAPLFLWLLLNFVIAFYLQGAGFFCIPIFFGLLILASFVISQKTNNILNLILSIPALIIFVPFIIMFPIGLGLKILAGSAVLTVLLFSLLVPVFGKFHNKRIWAILMFALSAGFFFYAHLNSNYETGKAKPNSLLYVYNADKKSALWATYDINLDSWTEKYLGANPQNAKILNQNPLYSKYNSGFTYTNQAPIIDLALPNIEFLKDSIVSNQRLLKIKISSKRKVNRYDIFANPKMIFYNLKANKTSSLGQKGALYKRKGKKLLSYYVVNNEPLELEFSIPKNTIIDMDLLESSFDLMTNPLFSVTKRESWMMPAPFVLNDAVLIQQKIKPTEILFKEKTITPVPKFIVNKDTARLAVDSLTYIN